MGLGGLWSGIDLCRSKIGQIFMKEFDMKRILVTGGAGFIGSAVCRHLVKEKGYAVLNLGKLTYAGVPESLKEVEDSPLYSFAKVDVCDKKAVSKALADFKPHAVMHLAAESHVDRSIDGPAAFMETNIMGTYNMLECARTYWQSLPSEACEPLDVEGGIFKEDCESLNVESGRSEAATSYNSQ